MIDARDDPRGGFVLALVVLLLFAIGVAGALGYQVVLTEAQLSVHAKETQRALSIARAGLQRYVGQQVGVHEDTVTYSIEDGNAVVIARKVAEIDDYRTLYVLESEGVYTDPTFTGAAARRTIYQHAIKKQAALTHLGALTQVTGDVRLHSSTRSWGVDQAGALECEQSNTDIIGVVMGSGSLQIDNMSAVNGSQDSLSLGSEATVIAALGVDWALFTSAGFPVDYEDAWPSCALPADSFTVTRFNGSLSAPSGACGRGVLIVADTLTPQDNFTWDGVVLAGYFNPPDDDFVINGLVVSGLNGLGGYTDIRQSSRILYNRCAAFDAGRRLSHFELIGSTWWERT